MAAAARRVFVIGNSMTDGMNYTGFPQLLARDGGSVSFGRQSGAGYSQSQNFNLDPTTLSTSGIDPARPTVKNPWGNYAQALAAGTWDAITVQPHDRRLLNDINPIGNPRQENVADVPMSANFLQAISKTNPDGQLFIYSRTTRRTDVNQDMTPTGKPFDYSTEWLRTYVDTGEAANSFYFSRSYVKQFMPLLRAAQDADPATRPMKDVRLIPVGEVYYQLDQAIKAGKFSGTAVKSILDFYRDQSHPSDDLGAYVIALSFYSSITGTDPRGVTPPSPYLKTDRIRDARVQQLLQQAVYDAMKSSHYAGWTTPLSTTPTQPTGNVRVYAFNDADKDTTFDSTEAGIAGVTVYLDADNDNVMDAGERRVVTGSNGLATFSNVPVGTYQPRAVASPTGFSSTIKPTAFALTAGTTVTKSLGFAKATSGGTPSTGTSSITGFVVSDTNRDGKWTSGEKAIAGRSVWIDLDNDGVRDSNEPTSVTNASGKYTFSGLAAGSYRLRQVVPVGWIATLPVKNMSLSVTIAAGALRGNVNFYSYAGT